MTGEAAAKQKELKVTPTTTYGPFHRLQSPTQSDDVAALQVASREMWGRPRQYSDIPQVQAYTGTLPDKALGLEFTTTVPPDVGTAPGHARWTGPRQGVTVQDGFAKIKVDITKNTQLPSVRHDQDGEDHVLAA